MALNEKQSAAVDAWLAANAPDEARFAKAILTAGELSTGDPTARSPKGARGLMQLTPIALKDIGVDPETFDYDNPAASLKAGVAYIRKLRDDYGLTNPLQLAAAYNAGPGTVKAAVEKGGVQFLPAETQGYVRRMYAALGQQGQQGEPVPREPMQPEAAGAAPESGMPANAASPAEALPVPPSGDNPTGLVIEEGPRLPPTTATPVPNLPPGAQPPGLGKTIATAPLRAAAGVADMAAQGGAMLFGGPNATPGDFGVPSATEAVEGAVGPAPEGLNRYVGATVEGATLGAPFGPAGAVIGGMGGLFGEAGGDLAEVLGIPRVVGAVAGGGIAGGVVAGGRGVGRFAKSLYAERQASKAAVRELEDAKTALVATDARVTAEKGATAETKAMAQATREAVDREVGLAVDDLLLRETPQERALTMQSVLQDRRNAIHSFVSSKYADFLRRAAETGRVVKINRLKFNAGEIVDNMVDGGLPRDIAVQRAEAITKMVDREAMTFGEAQALRTAIGKAYAGARGPAKVSMHTLQETLDDAIYDALPTNMHAEFGKLRASRRAEAIVFQNKYIAKALADTEEGRATATAYLGRMLNNKWGPDAEVAIDRLVAASGDGGREVLRDAALRHVVNAITSNSAKLGPQVQWHRLRGVMLQDDNLRPLVAKLIPADQQRHLLRLGDEAEAAYAEAQRAARDYTMTRSRGAQELAEARGRVLQARTALPERGESVLDQTLLAFSMGTGIRGGVGVSLYRLGAALRSPRNRQLLRKAARTAMDTPKGQDLFKSIATAAGVGAEPPPASASAPPPQPR